MNQRFATAVLAILTLTISGVGAIERGAKIIDTIGVEAWGYKNASYAGGSLWGEALLTPENQDWAIVAGITGGQLTFDDITIADSILWTGNLGVKWYLQEITSIQVTAGYGQMSDLDVDVSNLRATLKQRFIPASDPISPYVSATLMVQKEGFAEGDDSTDIYFEAHLGAEFASRDDLAFIFDIGFIQTMSASDETFDEQGIMAGFYMKYYWN